MKYMIYVGMSAIAGSTQEIEIELADNLTEAEVAEICRDTAFNEIDWNYEKEEE